MATPPVETPADATPETMKVMEDQFEGLDAVVDRMSPLFGQYMQLRQKSQSIFRRMNMIFSLGQGQTSMNFETFQKDAEELQKLYEEMVIIRADMAYDNLKKTFNMKSATAADMEGNLQSELETAMKPFETEELGSVRGRLAEICTEASQSPVGILGEGAIGYYIIDKKGQIIPHFQKLEKDIRLLEDTEKTFTTMISPTRAKEAQQLLGFIRKLRSGLEQIRNIDPQARELRQWQEGLKVHHDWRPLRMLLALTGGAFSVLGLGMAVAGKGFNQEATGLWMGVAILAARPDLLQSGEKSTLQSIQALDHKSIHRFLTEKDWSGEKGKLAFLEVQDAAHNGNPELFDGLKDAKEVYRYQIDELLGKKNKGPAAELLKSSKMSDKDRAQAIHLFGKEYDDGQKEMIEVALMWGNYGIVQAGPRGTP